MSKILVIKVQNNKFKISRVHFSKLKDFLNKKNTEKEFDEGYVLADMDNGLLINHQNAINIKKLVKKIDVLEV